MKLYIIRHGESIGNTKPGFIAGRSDPEGLTDKGKSQVIRTAWNLKDKPIDYIYSSPVARAQQTSKILNTFFNTNLSTLEWLTELHHGMFEGNYWWEVIDQIPAKWHKKREDYNTSYPGEGESMKTMLERVWEGLNTFISEQSESSNLILVSHQAVITAIRYCLENKDISHMARPEKQAKYLEFLHSTKIPNAGYIEVILENGTLKKLIEHSSFESVEASEESVSFYIRGIFDTEGEMEAKALTTASENPVFEVDNDHNYIAKILKDKDDAAALRQCRLYDYLNNTVISTAKIIFFDSNKQFFAYDFLVQDFLPGNDLKTCMPSHKEKLTELWEEIYNVLHMIHSLPKEEIQSFWFPKIDEQFQNWRTFMIYNINFTLYYLSSWKIPKKSKEKIRKDLLKLRTYITNEDFELKAIHGDVAPANIIIQHTEGQCRFKRIIDFEWARVGDPLWDLAYFWGWLERDSNNKAQEWEDILSKQRNGEMETIKLYKLLFHAWTVRDMEEYKDHKLRQRRGKESLEILRKFSG